ncbi:redox-regulated ATPase YchF [bacterium (Candidatus Torokbacteria) CG09_land_8_20_14_0_10_42_11]|nr:MAG: redox-regulated ATPase YchF [bacterium (Candidatus Torokbacteria) CG09_land_8_20_14_0_10_42_11]
MSLSIGIVGLPNVGKSTLFQTLTRKEVDRQNYPFCTIDPNVGVVIVPDERVDKLAILTHSAKKVYTTIEFTDIAGLVRDAHRGEGLGNKFLTHIRETDAVIYVLRGFANKKIISTQENVNPVAEKEILDTELILKDLETVVKIWDKAQKEAKTGDKESLRKIEILKKIKTLLEQGKILAEENLEEAEKTVLREYQLLTDKPRLYLLNGSKQEIASEVIKIFTQNNWPYLIIDIKNEFEAGDLSSEERVALGLPEKSGLDILIQKSYRLLNLITFLTTGEDETRAWTIKAGSVAPQAGGVIHSDFEKNFIRAEVINYQELLDSGSFARAREKGLLRLEGKEYIVQDGDVITIRHGA